MVRTHSAAMPKPVHERAVQHLLRADGQEDICFALWCPSTGAARASALVCDVLVPREGERLVHGNASFMPAFFERAMAEAAAKNCGLALMHSHPSGRGWQAMSSDDFDAESFHAGAAKGATGLPLVGFTLAGDQSWSARFWIKTAPREYSRVWCSSVRVVGDQLTVTYNDELIPRPRFKVSMERTTSAWGEERQSDLARLSVAIVGAGSVGNLVAEALARTGVQRITLLDFDSVEPHNLDRLLHAYPRDARLRRAKVAVLARALRLSATAADFQVTPLELSVAEPEGFRGVLDADVIFSCVDRPWARAVLNLIAYSHVIPVIDGGVAAEVHKSGVGVGRADWRAHLVSPGRRCLECLGQYDPGLVAVEREGRLDDPHYIESLPKDHPLRRSENVFAFSHSVASFEVLQFLAATVAPAYADPGQQMYHFASCGLLDSKHENCKPTCIYPTFVAKGDLCGVDFTATHHTAELARSRRKSQGARMRVERWVDNLWQLVYG